MMISDRHTLIQQQQQRKYKKIVSSKILLVTINSIFVLLLGSNALLHSGLSLYYDHNDTNDESSSDCTKLQPNNINKLKPPFLPILAQDDDNETMEQKTTRLRMEAERIIEDGKKETTAAIMASSSLCSYNDQDHQGSSASIGNNNNNYNNNTNHKHNNNMNNNMNMFYNRIGKAGSSTLINLFQKSINKPNVKFFESLVPSDRGSDEFLTRQGELELIQKIVGNPNIKWNTNAPNTNTTDHNNHNHNDHNVILAYHTFFLNFTRYGLPEPIYINLIRDPAKRYVSQYEFWKILPDIGKLVKDYGSTLEICLQGRHIGCPPLNYQTSYFCGHQEDGICSDPPNDATFIQAVKHVVHNYALVGTLERFDEFKLLFVTMFPEWITENKHNLWKKPTNKGQISNANKKKNISHYSEEDIMKKVKSANMYDVLLYEVVDKIMDKKRSSCSMSS